jgi:predicted DNA binding CopG/RHH family protein
MAKKVKPEVPASNEAAERAFWESHDSAGRIDWSRARRARFPHLKPTTTAISLRLPVSMLDGIKIEAHKRDVPYQSLIKTWLAEKLS